jgi:hypothetical protein
MKSGMEGVDHAAARRFAFSEGLVGTGWGLNRSQFAGTIPDRCTDASRYYERAVIVHRDEGFQRAFDVIANRMSIGDYCWSYVTHLGEYWCCRISGGFEYREGGWFDTFDWHMTRSCEWARVGTTDAVPGVIRRAFAGPFGAVTQITNGADRAAHAAELALGLRPPCRGTDLFAAAGPEDLEDLVALYLQAQGWSIYPSTAKVSTACYEFVMVNSQTGERAGIQVKSGNTTIGQLDVAEDLDRFFVFSPTQPSGSSWQDKRVNRISADLVRKFAEDNRHILPKRLRTHWAMS